MIRAPITIACFLSAYFFSSGWLWALDLTFNPSHIESEHEQTTSKARANDQPKEMPNPLTLSFALSQAGQLQHPRMQQALASQLQSLAGQQLAMSQNNIRIGLDGQLAAVVPSRLLGKNFPDRNTDHEARLFASKRLYDFGQQQARMDMSQQQIAASRELFLSEYYQHYLQILEAFFNVILADMENAYINEALSVAYIRYDRARARYELKKLSELEVLRLKSEYEKINTRRIATENAQRISRSLLAMTLNMPDSLPDILQIPELDKIEQFSINRVLPALEQLQQQAVEKNRQLRSLKHQIEAEKQQQKVYQAERYPVIQGRLESRWFSRELGGDDRARAVLEIDLPIYQGGETDARLLSSHAKLTELRAKYQQLARAVKQQVLEQWMQVAALKQQYQQVVAELQYRELYLDKSRSEYESELKTDLGDAMVVLSLAQLEEKKVLFQLALALARLDVLTASDRLYR